MPRCQAFRCSNEPSKSANISFFAIPDPEKDREYCQLWLNRLGINKFDIGTYVFNKNRLLCEEHFEPECFTNLSEYKMGFARRKILKEGAVPTIFHHKQYSEAKKESSSGHKEILFKLLQPDGLPSNSNQPNNSPPLLPESASVRDSDVKTVNVGQVRVLRADMTERHVIK